MDLVELFRVKNRTGVWIAAMALAGCLLIPSQAQAQHTNSDDPSPQFMPRFDFGVTVTSLGSTDPRFWADGIVGADLDVVDYGVGRTSLLAQYEVVMGNQLRPFDPNQSSYTFDISSSVRSRKVEIAGVFHHLSRHLSDRSNAESIAYNAAGVRLMHRFEWNETNIDVRGDLEKVVRRNFLDYSWTTELQLTARRPITYSTSLFGRTDVEAFGVERSISNRSTQGGLHIETGIHLNGVQGAFEFFGGWEGRVDAYPLDRASQNLSFVGFRFKSK